MVVIGPLSVQQGGALPPFSKVNKVSVEESILISSAYFYWATAYSFQSTQEPRSNGNGFSVPQKQQQPVVSKQAHHFAPGDDPFSPVYMDYENLMLTNELPTTLPTKKYSGDEFEFPQPMSLKYAELYSVPMSSQYPELYTSPGQYDEALFPVNTPNVIPNPCPPADFKQQAQLENKHPDASNDGDELDLYSLLALPAPSNKETEVSFANDCNPFNLYGFQPEELDLLDPALLDPAMPDDIHYWNGFQKESSNSVTKQSNADPVMSASYDPYGRAVQNKCDGEDTFHTSATVENILLLEGYQAMSPVHSELSMVSEDSMVPSDSPAASEKGLRDLFEQTFDLSDIEVDYMLPPPNKRQETPANGQHWGFEKKPQMSPPFVPPPVPMASPSPQTEPMSTAPSPQEEGTVKSKGKNKQNPTLLFGKDEGEIIHKLLVARKNAKSKPITRDKLITIPVEEFNQLLEDAQLTEIEVAFMKEWRRRGKNKAAAQVARKRKREEVSGLDEEVEKMRQQKGELEKKYDQLRSLVESLKERSMAAEDRLFQQQSGSSVVPVSRNTHLIHVTDDDKLLLIPKISSKIVVVNS